MYKTQPGAIVFFKSFIVYSGYMYTFLINILHIKWAVPNWWWLNTNLIWSTQYNFYKYAGHIYKSYFMIYDYFS